jgi:hypothetical protein
MALVDKWSLSSVSFNNKKLEMGIEDATGRYSQLVTNSGLHFLAKIYLKFRMYLK